MLGLNLRIIKWIGFILLSMCVFNVLKINCDGKFFICCFNVVIVNDLCLCLVLFICICYGDFWGWL